MLGFSSRALITGAMSPKKLVRKSMYCAKYSKTGMAFLLLDSLILTFSTSSRVPSTPEVEVKSSCKNFSASNSTW